MERKHNLPRNPVGTGFRTRKPSHALSSVVMRKTPFRTPMTPSKLILGSWSSEERRKQNRLKRGIKNSRPPNPGETIGYGNSIERIDTIREYFSNFFTAQLRYLFTSSTFENLHTKSTGLAPTRAMYYRDARMNIMWVGGITQLYNIRMIRSEFSPL